jgi:hypothetical protein
MGASGVFAHLRKPPSLDYRDPAARSLNTYVSTLADRYFFLVVVGLEDGDGYAAVLFPL